MQIHKNIIFYPLSLLYGGVTELRNRMFDWGILKSKAFDLPVISIGNLAVGGTGKTPHTEFLLENFSEKYKIAVLSRGYRRTTKGFRLAGKETSAKTIGDEPFQIFSKFPNVTVAVDEKRVHGIDQLQKLYPDTEIIILDDAYQHRYVKPGLSILLTDYSNLYKKDQMLPYGTLREWRYNSKRADIIVVTKCPVNIQKADLDEIRNQLNIKSNQQLYFSIFNYGKMYPVFPESIQSTEIDSDTSILLVTGIVKPEPIAEYLFRFTKNVHTHFFPDHHDFTKSDMEKIEMEFNQLSGKKIILTTEKDASRLKSNVYVSEKLKINLYALPLEVKILNNEQNIFIQKIEHYVRKNSRNR